MSKKAPAVNQGPHHIQNVQN